MRFNRKDPPPPMDDKDYLIHYGVLGMKWGVRKDRGSSGGNIRKSRRTKKYERQARKGVEGASELAKKSYEFDKWNKTTSRKDKKALKKANAEYNKRTRKEWVDAWNEASEEIDRNISPKYNEKLKKAGMIGEEQFKKAMSDPIKKTKYEKILSDYNTEVGKKRADMWLERFGEAPTWENWDTHPSNKNRKK